MSDTNPIGVMHVVDTLDVGGTETVAVNLVNALARDRYRAYLCATRRDGPLASAIAPHVEHLCLNRKGRIDLGVVAKLARFVDKANIHILHLHSSSLFFGVLVSYVARRHLKLIWHDHYGNGPLRSVPLYRWAASHVDGVIAVNELLAGWSTKRLKIRPDRVWYLPNFVLPPEGAPDQICPEPPGVPGSRIVCVANLKPPKDQATLIQAMRLVREKRPEAHLLLVGSTVDTVYTETLRNEVTAAGLQDDVSFLGSVRNVWSYLHACDIAVLTSTTEGLPLSLLEYGSAGRPTIATRVGQCAQVLDNGRAGILVDARSPQSVADAILRLLTDEALRKELGSQFARFVRENYGADAIVRRLCQIYETILDGPVAAPSQTISPVVFR